MASFIHAEPILLVFCGPEAHAEIIPGLGAPPALVLQLAPPYDSFARRAAGLPIQKLEDVAVHIITVDGLLQRTHCWAEGWGRARGFRGLRLLAGRVWLVDPSGLPLGCFLRPEWEGNLFALPRTRSLLEPVQRLSPGCLRPEDARQTSVVSF